MWFYIKKAFIPFIYLIFMAIIAVAILCIKNLTWLKIILLILNLALYGFIVGMIMFREGEDAVKVRHANDLERREMIRTGTVRPLKLKEEYKPYKGFIFGGIVLIPMILCLLIHTIILLCGGELKTFGAISSIIYFAFYAFFGLGEGSATMTTYYGSLVSVPVILALCGIAYIMGAKKIIYQQNKIEEQQRQIYGR